MRTMLCGMLSRVVRDVEQSCADVVLSCAGC